MVGTLAAVSRWAAWADSWWATWQWQADVQCGLMVGVFKTLPTAENFGRGWGNGRPEPGYWLINQPARLRNSNDAACELVCRSKAKSAASQADADTDSFGTNQQSDEVRQPHTTG